MIDIKLLSKVLKTTVYTVSTEGNTLIYNANVINLYELASLCKQYAIELTPSWKITSGLYKDKAFATVEYTISPQTCECYHYYADIEYEAVFKAMEVTQRK
jgi:hypothetical protein